MASTHPPPLHAARRWALTFGFVLLLLATALVYWPVLGFGFITYDDPRYVVDNPLVQQGLTIAGLTSAFSSFHVGYWIPVTLISLMLDAGLWGKHAGGFHLTNLLLHLANVTLFFFFLRRLTGRAWASALAAGLFALHPLHVQSVAWVTERKDVLSTFFWLSALVAYLAYLRRKNIWRYLLLAVLFALGLMAKPMLVTLPVVLLFLDFWPLDRAAGTPGGDARGAIGRWRPLVLEKAPLFAMAAIVGLLTSAAQRADSAVVSIQSLPPSTRVVNAIVGAAGYLAKAAWPQGLNVLYLYPTGGWNPWRIAASAAFLAAASFLAIRLWRSRGYVLMGWLWYLGTLLPVSGLFQAGDQVMADRFTYVPLQGIYLAVALGLADAAGRKRARRLAVAAGSAAALCSLALIAHAQVGTWRDSETLFRRAVDIDPQNWLARLSVGMALLDRGDHDAAMIEFTRTLNSAPAGVAQKLRVDIALAAGTALVRERKFGEAAKFLSSGLALDPENAALHNQLGLALSALERRAEALEHFRVALRSDPGMDAARYNLGLSLIEQARFAEAVPVIEELCRRQPGDGAAHYQLGIALREIGDTEAAQRQFAEVERLGSLRKP